MNKISKKIEDLIENKFSIRFKPTRDFYKRVGIGQKRFNLLRNNKESAMVDELKRLKEYFPVRRF